MDFDDGPGRLVLGRVTPAAGAYHLHSRKRHERKAMTTTHEDGSVTIKLATAVKHPDGDIAELKLRKPKAKDLRAMDKATGDIGKALALAQALSGVPLPYLEEMDGVDFIALSEAIKGFLQPSLATGS